MGILMYNMYIVLATRIEHLARLRGSLIDSDTRRGTVYLNTNAHYTLIFTVFTCSFCFGSVFSCLLSGGSTLKTAEDGRSSAIAVEDIDELKNFDDSRFPIAILSYISCLTVNHDLRGRYCSF